jgi:hypothetical protein
VADQPETVLRHYVSRNGNAVQVPRRSRRFKRVFQFRLAGRARAVDAAENLLIRFNAVSDDPAVAMRANRRQCVDRALEAIERVTFPADDYLHNSQFFRVT